MTQAAAPAVDAQGVCKQFIDKATRRIVHALQDVSMQAPHGALHADRRAGRFGARHDRRQGAVEIEGEQRSPGDAAVHDRLALRGKEVAHQCFSPDGSSRASTRSRRRMRAASSSMKPAQR